MATLLIPTDTSQATLGYLLEDGTIPLTANWDVGSFKLTMAGLTIDTADGIDYNPGSDIDTDLITVAVTGTPIIKWDESEDGFNFSKGIEALRVGIGVAPDATVPLLIKDTATAGNIALDTSDGGSAKGFINLKGAGATNDLFTDLNVTVADAVVDTDQPQWRYFLSNALDQFGLQRSPAGATWSPTTLLTVSSVGVLTSTGSVFTDAGSGDGFHTTGGAVRGLIGEFGGSDVSFWGLRDSTHFGAFVSGGPWIITGSKTSPTAADLRLNAQVNIGTDADVTGSEKLQVRGTTLIDGVFTANGGAVFNEAGTASIDFRIESDEAANLFKVDGDLDAVQMTPTTTRASASGAIWDGLDIKATTATISGSTNITTATGFNLINISQPTLTAGSALTVTNAATLYIADAPTGAGAGPATITNKFALWLDAGDLRIDERLLCAGVASFGGLNPISGIITIDESDATVLRGIFADHTYTGTATTAVRGIQGFARHEGSGSTLATLYGLEFAAQGKNSGTTYAEIVGCVAGGVASSAAAITTAAAFKTSFEGSSVAPTTVRGLWIDTMPGVSGVTTVEGIHIANISSGTTRYGIHQLGTTNNINVLAAATTIGADSTPTSGFDLDVQGDAIVNSRDVNRYAYSVG